MDSVPARVPAQAQYRVLRLPGGLPVLRSLRVVYGDRDRPVEVSVPAKAGHRYELRHEFAAAE